MGQSAIGLGGNVRLAEEEEENEEEEDQRDASRSWEGVLDEDGVFEQEAASTSAVSLEDEEEKDGDEGAGRAPAWGDVSIIEEHDGTAAAAAAAMAMAPTSTLTASAKAVLAAAEQSFASVGDEEAAAAAGVTSGKEGNSEFPVRMLVFAEEQEPRGETEEEREQEQEQGGDAWDSNSNNIDGNELHPAQGFDPSTTEAAADDAAAGDAGAAAVEDDDSGVLMMSRTEAGLSREDEEKESDEEDESEVSIGRGVVSFDEGEAGISGCVVIDGGRGGRESSVLGMVRAVRDEETAAGVGGYPLEEDSALASLDGNEGAAGTPEADENVALVSAKELEGTAGGGLEPDGGGVLGVTPSKKAGAAVPATPVTPDEC